MPTSGCVSKISGVKYPSPTYPYDRVTTELKSANGYEYSDNGTKSDNFTAGVRTITYQLRVGNGVLSKIFTNDNTNGYDYQRLNHIHVQCIFNGNVQGTGDIDHSSMGTSGATSARRKRTKRARRTKTSRPARKSKRRTAAKRRKGAKRRSSRSRSRSRSGSGRRGKG